MSITIYYTEIDFELSSDLYLKYLTLLPEKFQKRIKRYRNRNDQVRSIIGKVLLYKGLRAFGLENDVLKGLKTDQYSRPYIDEAIDFNISHSGKYVACGLTRSGRVGLDIEMFEPINTDDYIEFFDEGIKHNILEAEDKIIAFYKYWAMVEAVLKANGSGMHIPIADVKLDNNSVVLNDTVWCTQEVAIGKNLVCQCATQIQSPEIVMKRWSYN